MSALATLSNVLQQADPRQGAAAKRRTIACNLLARMTEDPKRACELAALRGADVLMRAVEDDTERLHGLLGSVQLSDTEASRDKGVGAGDAPQDSDDGDSDNVADASIQLAEVDTSRKRRADALRALGHLSFELGARTALLGADIKLLLRICAQSTEISDVHGALVVLANTLMPPLSNDGDERGAQKGSMRMCMDAGSDAKAAGPECDSEEESFF